MRKTGPRWFGFGVPLACIAGVVFGNFESTGTLLLFYMATLVFSLNAPDAFSRAASKMMSTKKVMGSLLPAAILSMLLPAVLFFTVAKGELKELIVAAPIALLVISRCFEELFASQNDSFSATLTTILTAIFLGGALSLVGDHSYGDSESASELAAAGITALVSGSIAIGFSRREWPRINFAILKETPAALARLLLYPILCLALMLIDTHFGRNYALSRAPVVSGLVGLIFLELSKSNFRRREEESAGLKTGTALLMVCVTGGLFLLSLLWWTDCLPLCQALILAAGAAALLLYAPWDAESILSALILLAAAVLICFGITPEYYSFPCELLIAPVAGIAMCGMMFRQWRELTLGARARRIRKKAMKSAR